MSSPETPPPSGSRSEALSASKVDGCLPQIVGGQDYSPASERILSIIDSLKQQVAADRCVYVKERTDENKLKLDGTCNQLLKLSQERRNNAVTSDGTGINLLTKRMSDAINTQNGSNIPVKNAVPPIKLAEVKRLPPYTTWIFLDRNQRMTEDQSVVGRRRIYYDQNGGEALICSDSEEEKIVEEENKKEFWESEDYILRMTIKEAGSSEVVLDALAQCFSRTPNEIKERYEVLAKGENSMEDLGNQLFDKDLDVALDSFDNLFCRRCFVFDCRLHGCSQDLVFPADKQLSWSGPDEEKVPCGPYCYQLVLKPERNIISSPMAIDFEGKTPSDGSGAQSARKTPVSPSREKRARSCQSESTSSYAKFISESSGSETRHVQNITSATQFSSPPKSKRVEHVTESTSKRQKKMETSDSDTGVVGSQVSTPLQKPKATRGRPRKIPLAADHLNPAGEGPIKATRGRPRKIPLAADHLNPAGEGPTNEVITRKTVTSDTVLGKEECVDESIYKLETSESEPWKVIEKSLYQKGLEIFGRNSCLIARNLMNGMKTCSEVFRYMNSSENRVPYQVGDGANSTLEGHSNVDNSETTSNEVRRRSRYLGRRSRVRRLKYTSKSSGYQSFRKRFFDKKDQPCRQFNPCGCESACGKECPCHVNGTCCEKYCGCPKTCKNRFRGCHCAKSQCRSRQCPCFAADRECDPDVCRNCWIGCGDGSLGVPSQRGDNYECRNMKLLLKQQQRVLLGPSDVSGWGAFLKNTVSKNEYLGEYTGEIISHREADKRGKIYDRENQSYLFNLNDQFVLDAFRRGDKLKFANHSPDPNCYAKVMMVAGDHRVGIYAKERINAGEELFYDYRYEADRAPAWAKKPDAPGSKKDDTGPSSGRAKKLA